MFLRESKGLKLCLVLPVILSVSCLSVLLTSVHAHSQQSLTELQDILKKMKTQFNNLDALFYTPPAKADVCTNTLMYCYLLELFVILSEEGGRDDDLNTIYHLKKSYSSYSKCQMGLCQQCEEHPKTNSTVFSQTMDEFIKRLSSKGTYKDNDCD